VVEARDFAADSLALDAGRSYTTFSRLDSDTLALVVSAAHQDRFAAHTWWFPIVGHVPYKGFFSEARARREMERLERRGFDTYMRPTSAFSTLGWFNDPLVSPLLRYDSVSLANTVIHEIFHNTLYLSGQAMFNESLAQFVGSRGAIAFFCSRMGEASRRVRRRPRRLGRRAGLRPLPQRAGRGAGGALRPGGPDARGEAGAKRRRSSRGRSASSPTRCAPPPGLSYAGLHPRAAQQRHPHRPPPLLRPARPLRAGLPAERRRASPHDRPDPGGGARPAPRPVRRGRGAARAVKCGVLGAAC
jgi:hypothetical protein